MTWFARKSENIRYSFIYSLAKIITPNLYDKEKRHDVNRAQIRAVPRPSTLLIKKYFNDDLLIGCELGVDSGENSESILKELLIKKLYLIDFWEGYDNKDPCDQFGKYIYVKEKFGDLRNVEIIKDYSVNACVKIEDEELDFIYIDCNHKYDFVMNDLYCYYKKVKKGGVVAGHDIQLKSVLQAVIDFTYEKRFNLSIIPPDWYFIRR